MKPAAFLPLAILAAVLWRPAVGGNFEGVRRLIAEEVASGSVPSAAVSVVQEGRIVWEEAFGLADIDRQVAATPSTPYYLASVTKTLTGSVLASLAERGVIELDRPINAYLGPAKVRSPLWNAEEATVRRVANHLSGLTTYNRDCAPSDHGCAIGDTIRDYGILVRPPGRDFDYSNLGYGILGEVVARASNRGFGEVLRRDIFKPLRMNECGLAGDRAVRDAAIRYNSRTRAKTPMELRSTTPGASGAFCSVHDLAVFSAFVLASQSDALLSVAVPAGQGQRYSMGWWIEDDFFGYESLFGSGGTTDASATVRLIPSEHVAAVAVANTGTNLTMKAVEEAIAEVVPGIAERRAHQVAPAAAPTRSRPPAGALAGIWAGAIVTPHGSRTMRLAVSTSGEVEAAIGDGPLRPFTRGGAGPTRIYGVMTGDLRVEELPNASYDLAVGVESAGERLVGFVTSQARPGMRAPALSYWVDLRKSSKH
jgi:CubicO group peptidase (beta-lactamase class C family)